MARLRSNAGWTDNFNFHTNMDVGTGGAQGARALHFSKIWAKYPFSCNLVAPLKALNVLPDPLVNLHLGTGPFSSCKEFYRFIRCFIPKRSAYISLEETLPRCPSIHVPPNFCNASYVPVYKEDVYQVPTWTC